MLNLFFKAIETIFNVKIQRQVTVTKITTPPPAPTTPPPAPRHKNGNGHVSMFMRKLNTKEKDFIYTHFLSLNGEFNDIKKSCSIIRSKMSDEISIWQVTGYVSYLHREVAKGNLEVSNMVSYDKFIRLHKKLWSQYNSPKYQAKRAA